MIVYDPKEANKTYVNLLIEKGAISGMKGAIFVSAWFCYNQYGLNQNTPIPYLILGFFICSAYFTWKPKLIRFLRGILRGEEFRNKSDD